MVGSHDIDFLTGFANVLAEAVATSARTAILQATIEQMKILVEEKDRLLDQKKVLAEELQHRVRNNLQLVYGMLSKQVGEQDRGSHSLAAIYSPLHRIFPESTAVPTERLEDDERLDGLRTPRLVVTVSAECKKPVAILRTELDYRRYVVLSELFFKGTNIEQSLVPTPLQLSCDQSIGRIDFIVLTMRTCGLEPCLL